MGIIMKFIAALLLLGETEAIAYRPHRHHAILARTTPPPAGTAPAAGANSTTGAAAAAATSAEHTISTGIVEGAHVDRAEEKFDAWANAFDKFDDDAYNAHVNTAH